MMIRFPCWNMELREYSLPIFELLLTLVLFGRGLYLKIVRSFCWRRLLNIFPHLFQAGVLDKDDMKLDLRL